MARGEDTEGPSKGVTESARRPFRFGVLVHRWGNREEWITKARQIEAQGYSTFLLPDHLEEQFAAIPAIATAAGVTTALRFGSFVCSNDFRHPVLLAKDIATLDVLTVGQFELGLGAGWRQREYEQAGITYDPASVRLSRLEEALRVLKELFADEPATFSGNSYAVSDLAGAPKPAQQAHPPILVGGGGRRVLSIAAREADIVGLSVRTRPDGQDWSTVTAAATAQKLDWIHRAAGDRFDELELNIMVYAPIVTDDRLQVARQMVARYELTEDEVLGSPHFLIGSMEQIGEDLQRHRERHGISYFVVPEVFSEAFAPVVARLADT
jgi:probable F420-dependent oxidoreductase